MSKTTWGIGTIALVVVGSALAWLWPERAIKNFPPRNTGPIVFVGDSLVEGVGASDNSNLPTLLGNALKQEVLNFGVAGHTSADGLAQLSDVTILQPRLAIVLLGGNDFLRKVPRQETESNLTRIVTTLQSTGAVVLLLGVRSGIFGGGADEMFEAVAEATGAAYEEDVLKGVFGDPALMSDAIHPNDAGYAKIAERLLPTIKKLLNS